MPQKTSQNILCVVVQNTEKGGLDGTQGQTRLTSAEANKVSAVHTARVVIT